MTDRSGRLSGRRLARRLSLVAGLALIAAGLWMGDLEVVQSTSTYRNFDVADSDQSAVQYLSPGGRDIAKEGSYTFDGPAHATPLIALGIVFVVFFLLRNVGARRAGIGLARGITQWATFVIARAGVLRVAGVFPVARCSAGVFPFLNCQACEMASGACPVGQVQNSLLHRRLPLLAVGTVLVGAALLGRWICGWLCPFGLLSDIADRVSLKRWQPRRGWYAGGLVVLGLLVAATLAFVATGVVRQAPFCSTICASGKILGLLPYYVTTGAGEASQAVPAIVYHAAILVVLLLAAVLISGRVWCRYLCPLGAALGTCNRFSALRIEHRADNCNDCGRCVEACPMDIDLAKPDYLTQSACIRCGRCVDACNQDARVWHYPWTPADRTQEEKVPRETVPAR